MTKAGATARERENPRNYKPMRHEQFELGGTFWFGGDRWRCTDIGTRTVTAIKLDHDDDPSWYNGPPYAVAEAVFDEYDIEGCTLEPEPEKAVVSVPSAEANPPEATDDAWDDPEDAAQRRAQAQALREQVHAGGLRFEAYLPPALAGWLLTHIEQGTFRDPSGAVFVILGEHQELEPHTDLRRALLHRRIQAAIDDPRPPIPAEDVFRKLEEQLAAPLPEPAVWRKQP
jgi:hypothetical protein